MITEKLQECRVELQNKKLKKSGKNKFAGFEYFELRDFLPTVNEMFAKKKMFSNFSIKAETAVLMIVDTEDKSAIEFTSPIAELELKGCNAIQALGGVHTYLKRYLYLNALEIVEADIFDSVSGSGELAEKKKTATNNDDDIFAGLDECKTLAELKGYYAAFYPKVTNKKAFVAKKDELKERLSADV